MPHHLPNFLIAGAPRCGTTSLYYYLKEHPEVFMSPVKEPNHFVAEAYQHPQAAPGDERRPWTPKLADYQALFAGVKAERAIGEASVSTLQYHECTIPAIQRLLGDPRIIISLRNPVDRAYSAYLLLSREGREAFSFEEGLAREAERLAQNWSHIWGYRRGGLYVDRVRAFQASFSRVKLIVFDDLEREPAQLVRDVFRFLEVDPEFCPNLQARYNAGGVARLPGANRAFSMKNGAQRLVRAVAIKLLSEAGWARLRERLRARVLERPELSSELRAELTAYYRDEIKRLEDLLGRDLGHWMNV